MSHMGRIAENGDLNRMQRIDKTSSCQKDTVDRLSHLLHISRLKVQLPRVFRKRRSNTEETSRYNSSTFKIVSESLFPTK